MGETRNVFIEPQDRRVIRTADVYQTETETGTDGYSDTLLDVVAHFKNSGAPEGFNARCMVGKSKRGEVAIRLYAAVDPETEMFLRVGFKSRGCLAMTACSSMICMMIEGKTIDQALALTENDLKKALDGVPWDRAHTVYFAIEAVHALAGDFLMNRGAKLEQLDERVPCNKTSVACLLSEHCSLRDGRIELRLEEIEHA